MQHKQDSVTGQEKARNNFAREQIASHLNRAHESSNNASHVNSMLKASTLDRFHGNGKGLITRHTRLATHHAVFLLHTREAVGWILFEMDVIGLTIVNKHIDFALCHLNDESSIDIGSATYNHAAIQVQVAVKLIVYILVP
jgi:hypothetical protein